MLDDALRLDDGVYDTRHQTGLSATADIDDVTEAQVHDVAFAGAITGPQRIVVGGACVLGADDLERKFQADGANESTAVDIGFASQLHWRCRRGIETQPLVLGRHVTRPIIVRRKDLINGRDFDADDQWVSRIDPVRVQDVAVALPELRPEIGIPVKLAGEIPERVSTLHDIDLGTLWERCGWVPSRPMIPDHVQRLGWCLIRDQAGGRE
jgi:hypothetical protein